MVPQTAIYMHHYKQTTSGSVVVPPLQLILYCNYQNKIFTTVKTTELGHAGTPHRHKSNTNSHKLMA